MDTELFDRNFKNKGSCDMTHVARVLCGIRLTPLKDLKSSESSVTQMIKDLHVTISNLTSAKSKLEVQMSEMNTDISLLTSQIQQSKVSAVYFSLY